MKKLYFLLFTILTTSLSFGQDLILTGVFDGPLTGGAPKVIELYVKNDIADLSIYGVESANNGAAAAAAEYTFPNEAKTAGTYIYIATESPLFTTYFGFAPTYLNNVANNNGDDAVLLYKNGVVEDVFGQVGTDGTGTFWDNLDGWAYRNVGVGPNTTFTQSEWVFSGIDATDGCTTNGSCASFYPIGRSTLSTKNNQIENFNMSPNPTSLGYVTISSRSNAAINVSVFDVLGKQVLKQTVSNNRLNVSKLNAGIYIVKAEQDNAITTKKLVIK